MRPSVSASAKALAIVAALLGVVGLVSACGDAPTHATQDRAKVIDVTFTGDSASPDGGVIAVNRGQQVEFEIKADGPGQIRVRSHPAKVYRYGAGTTRISIGSFDAPGRVEVRSQTRRTTICVLEIK